MARSLGSSTILFATSHGKGAVDGVGSTVKRAVRNAEQFSEVAEIACPGIQVLYISKEEVEGMKQMMDEEVFEGTKTMPGTREMHHLEVVGDSLVKALAFKGASSEKLHNFK
jgi:hypothetical protein